MNKPRLILLSDIFGNSKGSWMDEYRSILTPHFQLIEYDSRVLAEITTLDQKQIHSEFVNGGIERAVQNLLRLESDGASVLGFSVGGTIAWKYALEIEHNISLHLVSATRLRNETEKPSSNIHLYFGELESNGPTQAWFENFHLIPTILEKEDHECYKATNSVKHLSSQLIS
jgi:hypothetical protein